MLYAETKRSSCKGHELFVVSYFPSNQPIHAILCFHHGVSEHVGRYRIIFTKLADAGIAVFAADATGHGQSGGPAVYIERFSYLLDDFESLCNWAMEKVKERSPETDLPVFLGGQSLGGLVAALTTIREQDRYAGLLLCSPALDVEWTPMLRFQAAIGGVLSTLVPRANIVAAVNPAHLNKDPEKVREYLEDPLCHQGPLPARTAYESMLAFKKLGSLAPTFEIPLYAHHGTADKVTSLSATKYVGSARPDSIGVRICSNRKGMSTVVDLYCTCICLA